MKKCPRCKMTVDTIGVCPVCGEDILDVKDSGDRAEKYALNKYFWAVLWWKHRFAFISVCFVLLAGLVFVTRLQWQYVFPVLLAAVSIGASLFKNWFVKDEYDWFEEMCALAVCNLLKYLCGGLAIFISALMVLFG